MKFYYKDQLIRTSKTHAYNWAILTERPDGTYACHGSREWKLHQTIYWADNSVEEIWIDKNGATKSIMTVGPHGDAC